MCTASQVGADFVMERKANPLARIAEDSTPVLKPGELDPGIQCVFGGYTLYARTVTEWNMPSPPLLCINKQLLIFNLAKNSYCLPTALRPHYIKRFLFACVEHMQFIPHLVESGHPLTLQLGSARYQQDLFDSTAAFAPANDYARSFNPLLR